MSGSGSGRAKKKRASFADAAGTCKAMVFEVREFVRLIEAKEVEHKYLKYSLDTIRVIDEARRPRQTHE